MQRLAAQSAIGPPIILDLGRGVLIPGGGTGDVATGVAQAAEQYKPQLAHHAQHAVMSKLETCVALTVFWFSKARPHIC